MSSSASYWDSVGNRLSRLLHSSLTESLCDEDSQGSTDLGGMNHRNDENRSRRSSKQVGHVVETRSRTRASLSSPNTSKSHSNLPSPAINGFHDDDSMENRHFAVPTISPRKLKELRELNEMSTWRDPSDGKHARSTRRSLTSQRTSPRMPALKCAPHTSTSTPSVFPPRVSTRSQAKHTNGTNGIAHSPEPSSSSTPSMNGIYKRKNSIRFGSHLEHLEPVPKKLRVSHLKIKLPSRIAKIKRKPKKQGSRRKHRPKPYKTKNVLSFETTDVYGNQIYSGPEALVEHCMKKKIPTKKLKSRSPIKLKQKGRPRDSDQAYEVLAPTLGKIKTNDANLKKSIANILEFPHKAFPQVSLAEKVNIRRTLRLKRLRDADFLLPFPRRRIQNNPKFKVATKRIQPPPLRNGIKWLAFFTPCQRSCTCMKFKSQKVKWDSAPPDPEAVKALGTDSLCSTCKHPLWIHRRKYDDEERHKRYAVVRDIINLQKIIQRETNSENLRVFFILLKDLISILIENQPLPKEIFASKRSLQHDLSIRRHVVAFMQTPEARKLGFLNRHAYDLIQTLEEFTFPPPDKLELYSYRFMGKKCANTVVERNHLTWYRHFYLRWVIFCRLPFHLKSLPKFDTCNIMSFQFIELFDEYISHKLEQRYLETNESGVKIVAVMFRMLRIFAKKIHKISPWQVKQKMKGRGVNVLADVDLATPRSPDAMETRNAPALDIILNEPSGPFRDVPRFDKNSAPLEVMVPQPFADYFRKLRRQKKYKLFLKKGEAINKQSFIFKGGPSTLTEFSDISKAVEKVSRVSRYRSNCDRERAAGQIEMLVIRNNTSTSRDKMNDFLIQFISIIHRQLPKMPKHYIVRLVMDGKHRSMMLVKYNKRGSTPGWQVLGGICFRPFITQCFSEIVFVAVHADHQVRGYGGYLMDELKRYHVEKFGFPHLLTYADKNAIGYFKKQGFSREIGISEEHYDRFIKQYEGAKLMYCHSRHCNTPEDVYYWAYVMIRHLKNMYHQLCPEWKKRFEGLQPKFLEYDLLPMKIDRNEKVDNYGLGLSCEDIGLPPLFWKRQYELIELNGGPASEEEFDSDEEEMGLEDDRDLRYQLEDDDDDVIPAAPTPDWKDADAPWNPEEEDMTQMMYMFVEAIRSCPYSWPFHYPVDEYDAPTYTEEIPQPMTLEIVEDRLDWGYYIHERMLFIDLNRIFLNCYAFNEDQESPYYHACYRLHQYFNSLSLQIFGDRVAAYLLPIPESSTLRKPHQKASQVVFDPLKPYWYPIRHIIPPPPTPKHKKTSSKKKLTKKRSKSVTRKQIKSETPVRDKTPTRFAAATSSTRKVQTKLVFNQGTPGGSGSGFKLEFLDEGRRTTRAATRTSTSTTPITPTSARRRRR